MYFEEEALINRLIDENKNENKITLIQSAQLVHILCFKDPIRIFVLVKDFQFPCHGKQMQFAKSYVQNKIPLELSSHFQTS